MTRVSRAWAYWLSVFDIAYQFGIGHGVRTVSGSAPSATGQTTDGGYQYFSHALLVTIGLHF